MKDYPAPRESLPVSLGDVSDATTTKLAQLRQHRFLSESIAAKESEEQNPQDITVPLFQVNRALEVIIHAGDQLTQVTNELDVS